MNGHIFFSLLDYTRLQGRQDSTGESSGVAHFTFWNQNYFLLLFCSYCDHWQSSIHVTQQWKCDCLKNYDTNSGFHHSVRKFRVFWNMVILRRCQYRGYIASMIGWSMNVEQLVAGETQVLGVDQRQCHFAHHKSHITWPRVEETEPPRFRQSLGKLVCFQVRE
jgi:hypothetical protein